MGRQKFRKQRQKKQVLSALTGAGLLILGIVSFLFLAQSPDTSAEASANERSVTPMEVSFPAPELSLENLEGDTQSLADFKGNVVLVNNWATWCPPCKAEIPTLEAYYKAHTTDGFVIIGVEAGEPQNDVLKFVQDNGMTYPVWIDLNGAALDAFNNENLPSSYVIDRKGTVRLAWVGEISSEMLEKYITPLLMEN